MEERKRQQWLEAANDEWARVLQDPLAGAELAAEQVLWDATLADGLEDGPWEPMSEDEQSEPPCN